MVETRRRTRQSEQKLLEQQLSQSQLDNQYQRYSQSVDQTNGYPASSPGRPLEKRGSVDSLATDDTDLAYQNDYYYRDRIEATLHFLYRPHSISVLVGLMAAALYVALVDFNTTPVNNVKM